MSDPESSPDVPLPDYDIHTPEEQVAIREALTRDPGEFRLPTVAGDEQQGRGQRLADAVTGVIGSWRFIAIQGGILTLWLIINSVGWIRGWDPYPFILLNLVLSFQAAFTAPIIMMSQNRQSMKDRLHAEHDFQIDIRAELEVAAIQERLNDLGGRQWDALVDLQTQQLDLLRRIDSLTGEVHALVRSRETTTS